MTVDYDQASDALADAFRAAWLDPGAVDDYDWNEHVEWLLDMLEDGWEIDDAAKHLAERIRQEQVAEAAGAGGIPIPWDAPQWPFGGVPTWWKR